MNEPEHRQETLLRIWEEHVRHEFATHDTAATLATMVADAYVNHMPVLTGGRGRDELREFYSTRFIPQMPPDTEMTPISRTIGADQLVESARKAVDPTLPANALMQRAPRRS
jgi:carboxymethylenebutenolidase